MIAIRAFPLSEEALLMVKLCGFTKHLKVSAVTSTVVCARNETWFEIINMLLLILNEWSKIVVSRRENKFSIIP